MGKFEIMPTPNENILPLVGTSYERGALGLWELCAQNFREVDLLYLTASCDGYKGDHI